MDELTDKQIAELAQQFLESDFGQYYLSQMNLQYNGLHQRAEGDIEPHQKARFVDNAAGLKFAIGWLTNRDALLKAGHYAEKPDEQ